MVNVLISRRSACGQHILHSHSRWLTPTFAPVAEHDGQVNQVIDFEDPFAYNSTPPDGDDEDDDAPYAWFDGHDSV